MTYVVQALVQFVVVPALKALVGYGVKKLKKAKNGVPKELGLVMLEAVAENEANPVQADMLETARNVLAGKCRPDGTPIV